MTTLCATLIVALFGQQSADLGYITWVTGSQATSVSQPTPEQLNELRQLPDGVIQQDDFGAIIVKSGQRLVFLDPDSTGLRLLEAVTSEIEALLEQMKNESKRNFQGTALQLPHDPNSIISQYVRRPIETANEVVGMTNVQVVPELQIVLENNASQTGTFSSGRARSLDPSVIVPFSPKENNALKLRSNSLVPTSLTTTAVGRFRQSADIADSTQYALRNFWSVFEVKKIIYNETMDKFMATLFEGAFPETNLPKLKNGEIITDLRNIGNESAGLKGFTFTRSESSALFDSARIKSVQKKIYLSATFAFSDGRTQPISIELLSRIP